MARFRAIVRSQLGRLPRAESYSSARSHRTRNVSCTTSEAIDGSRLVRIAAPKTRSPCRSYRRASASCDPSITARIKARSESGPLPGSDARSGNVPACPLSIAIEPIPHEPSSEAD